MIRTSERVAMLEAAVEANRKEIQELRKILAGKPAGKPAGSRSAGKTAAAGAKAAAKKTAAK